MFKAYDLSTHYNFIAKNRVSQGRDHMVVGFTTTCAISAYMYHHLSVLETTLCDKVCRLLATGQWFSSGTLISSTNKTDCHDITETLLKMVLNTIIRGKK